MKRLLLPLGLASLAITLALIAGSRLPEGAQPVIIGVIAGVAASLPTSLIIVWRVSKRTTRPATTPMPQTEPAPAIIVVPPAARPTAPPPPAGPAHERRPFTIIGGDDESGA